MRSRRSPRSRISSSTRPSSTCSRGSSATSSPTPTGAADRHDRRAADRERRRRATRRIAPTRSGLARPRRGAGERARCGARGRPLQGAASHRMIDDRDCSRRPRRRPFARAQRRGRSVREALARIEALDPQLHAFNTVVADRALARAAAIDREFDRWRDAPLAGVPVALKDNICTRGVRTTASSRMLEHYRAAVRRDGRRAPRSGRRDRRRQDQLRRVRDGLVERELGVRARAQSVGARSHSGRHERRLGGRRGRAV